MTWVTFPNSGRTKTAVYITGCCEHNAAIHIIGCSNCTCTVFRMITVMVLCGAEPTADLGFHMLVSCSWAVGMQALQYSGIEDTSSNSLTTLNWPSDDSVEVGVHLSCTSYNGGKGETNHNGSLTAGHMKSGLGGDCIRWSGVVVGCVSWSGVAVDCVNLSPI